LTNNKDGIASECLNNTLETIQYSNNVFSGSITPKTNITCNLNYVLAILYCSCERNESFGEMIISKVTESLIPLSRTSSIVNTNNENNINWSDIFYYIDLHCFITFGVIYGLIRRVHEIPYVFDYSFKTYATNMMNNNRDGYEYLYQDTSEKKTVNQIKKFPDYTCNYSSPYFMNNKSYSKHNTLYHQQKCRLERTD